MLSFFRDINYIGTWTLYKKEVHRFIKVYNQTLFAPVITSLLFLAIFNLALGHHVDKVGDIPFGAFMGAGLVMMTVTQNAFANTSSSFVMGKVLGVLIDYLTPPISTGELILGMVGAGITRGILVGLLVLVSLAFFIPISPHSALLMIFHLISASLLLSLLGLLTGIFAESFDQMAAITGYIITPLAFLSGTFYSVHQLPAFWQTISHLNPFFYMIDGFRYGLTGYHDGNIMAGGLYLIGCIITIWIVIYRLIAIGYRIKQ